LQRIGPIPQLAKLVLSHNSNDSDAKSGNKLVE
jgi:hypothetical protein